MTAPKSSSARGRYLALLCLLPFAVCFVIFQIAPLAWVAINSLQSEAGWGVDNFSKVFASKFYLQALQRSYRPSCAGPSASCSARRMTRASAGSC